MTNNPSPLLRVVGLPGAVTLGLGSILGSGVFVSLLFVAEQAGSQTLICVAMAATLAMCNGLSSAQLASAHPVSGGSYEYGYRYLNPPLGFTAGWMFLAAKSASAATAALGFASYLTGLIPAASGVDPRLIAVVTLLIMTGLVIAGVRRSIRVNAALVLMSLAGLSIVCLAAIATHQNLPSPAYGGLASGNGFRPETEPPPPLTDVLEATALCFVAFTGYGRVATMGEEIRQPQRNIPIAVVLTLAVTLVVYAAVGQSILTLTRSAVPGTAATARGMRTLTDLVESTTLRAAAPVVTAGAAAAMLGVLLNLLLGLSRVALAMARRGDLPAGLAQLSGPHNSPRNAVVLVATIILTLILPGDMKAAWSLSAFTVLIYYATANLCALRQPVQERRFPRLISITGLLGCLGLAPFVPSHAWLAGTSLIAIGLIWHRLRIRRLTS